MKNKTKRNKKQTNKQTNKQTKQQQKEWGGEVSEVFGYMPGKNKEQQQQQFNIGF